MITVCYVTQWHVIYIYIYRLVNTVLSFKEGIPKSRLNWVVNHCTHIYIYVKVRVKIKLYILLFNIQVRRFVFSIVLKYHWAYDLKRLTTSAKDFFLLQPISNNGRCLTLLYTYHHFYWALWKKKLENIIQCTQSD